VVQKRLEMALDHYEDNRKSVPNYLMSPFDPVPTPLPFSKFGGNWIVQNLCVAGRYFCGGHPNLFNIFISPIECNRLRGTLIAVYANCLPSCYCNVALESTNLRGGDNAVRLTNISCVIISECIT
jgi:hypothetical protein